MKDYKKKYEDALNKAKENKPLEEIFPELKESEDEKIRKALIRSFTNQHSGNFPTADGFTREQILAWVEKQGEQNNDKIVEKAKTERQRVLLTETSGNAYIDWDCRSLDDVEKLLTCGLNFIQNTKENKQTIPDSRFEGCSVYIPTRYDNLKKQGEQKSTWSEEDEKILKLSLENLTELKDRFGEKYGKVGDCIDWLKSLKERMKGGIKL